MTRPESRLDRLARLLWGLALVTLPVTSFRYFPFLGGETSVKPLALYPLAVLLPLLLVRAVREQSRQAWNGAFIPLGLFLLAALAATAWGGLYAPLDLYSLSYWERALRAWVTLAVGLVFLLCALWMNHSEEDVRFTLKWLYIGLLLDFIWGLVQASAIYLRVPPKRTVDFWQELFSARGLVKSKRVSGLAFEPSWLANQMVMLYLPWLFAAVLKGCRISRHRWVEPALLLMAVVLILFTFSRGGIFLALLAGGLTFLLTGRAQMAAGRDWLLRPFKSPPVVPLHRLRDWALRAGVILLLAGILVGGGLFLSQRNYFAQLWRSEERSLIEYAIDNYAGARLAHAWAALETFQARPWTGVGLGASGLYIYQNLPDWSKTTIPEIARQLSPENRVYPNPKNLYVRLLAETGLFGFWLFVIFYLFVLGKIQSVLLSRRGFAQFVGAAGLFTWLAVVLYGFTQDSFATPNIWLGFGILLGMADHFAGAEEA